VAIPDLVRAELDLELGSLGTAEAFAGGLARSTLESYVPPWKRFRRWCRPPLDGREAPVRWLTPLPATDDTLREYVDALCQLGWAPPTIRKERSAIITFHRLHGVPVPDGHAASAVLKVYKATLRAAGYTPRRAEALPLDDVLRLLAACPLGESKGHRDAVLIVLAYSGLRPGRLVTVTLDQVAATAAGLRIAAGDGMPELTVEHWRSAAGEHDPARCPVEIVLSWVARLLEAGSPASGPMVRAVDKFGHIAGADDVFAGPEQPRGGGIAVGGINYALAGILTRAGVDDPSRYGWESFWRGGRIDRRLHGATVVELAAVTGLREDSGSLLDVVRDAEARAGE
jgi:hypothetical protein